MNVLKKFMKKACKNACKNKRNADQAEIPVEERVHERITCDNCEKSPIIGVRYKCAECPNFDLCADCEDAGVHSHHTFLKVKIPQGIEIHQAFRTEDQPRHQKEEKKNKREKKCWRKEKKDDAQPLIDQVFQYQPVLDQLTALGINPEVAKAALIQHAGNFDLACSTASKEMAAKDDKMEEEKEKEEKPRGRCGRGRGRGRRGCHGFGGHGGHGFENHPFANMLKKFLGGMKQGESSDDSSDEDSFEEKKKKRQENRAKRPVIINQDSLNEVYFTNETIFHEITVQNQTKWPVHIDSIKKVEASGINFEGIEVGTSLKHEEISKLSVPITMPSQPGAYEIKLAFFHKNKPTGETLSLKFNVQEDSAF